MAEPARPTYGAWTSGRIGGGGYLVQVHPSAQRPERVYLVPDVCGLYRSDDGARSFRRIDGTLPTHPASRYVVGLSIDPRDDDTIVIAVGCRWFDRSGIWVSKDAGQTWENTLVALFNADDETRYDGIDLRRDPTNPDRLIAVGTLDGVFESIDNGQTWQERGLKGIVPSDVLIDRIKPQRILIAAATTDAYFAKQYLPPGEDKVVTQGAVWSTQNSGETWEKLGNDNFTEFVQDPLDASVVYGIRNESRLMRSSDFGTTWEVFSDGLKLGEESLPWYPVDEKYLALTVAGNDVMTTSAKGTIYKLDRDAGRWVRVVTRDVIEPKHWWGATKHNPDFGVESQFPDGGYINTMSSVSSLMVSPHDPELWWMTDWYSLYRSEDAGGTFVNTTEGIESTYVHDAQQDATDPMHVYLGLADVGMFLSRDGGHHFVSRTNGGQITNNIKRIAITKADPNRLYAIGPNPPGGGWMSNHVFTSKDRGWNWNVSEMTGLPAMTAGSHDGSGGGLRINTIVANDRDSASIYVALSGPIGEGGGVYHSTDFGYSWTAINDGLPQSVELFRSEIFSGGQELALGIDGVLLASSIKTGRLFKLTPDAESWEELKGALPSAINDIIADPHTPGRFYAAVPDAGLFRTDDNGNRWDKLDTPVTRPGMKKTQHVTVDRQHPGRLSVGTDEGVLFSADSGDSWHVLDLTLPDRTAWNRGAFAGDRLVIGSAGGGAYFITLPTTPTRSTQHDAPNAGDHEPVSLLVNGDMTLGAAQPEGWLMWSGEGRAQLSRDTKVFGDGPASLRLASVGGPAYAIANQPLGSVPTRVRISGTLRSSGSLQECVVAVQCFDASGNQVAWLWLADGLDADQWKPFDSTVQIPAGVANAVVVMTLKGDGQVHLDAVRAVAQP